MPIKDIDTVFYTALFLVPGFIIKTITSMFTPTKKSIDINCILEYLLYSLLNFFIVNIVFPNTSDLDTNVALWLIIKYLLSSIILSVIVIILDKLFRLIINKSKVDFVNEYASAWDYMFYEIFNKKEQYLEIKLINGETKYGIFSVKSYVPIHDEGSDLYLDIQTDKNFKFKEENNNSIYISKDQIQQIIVHKKGTK